MRCEEPGYRLQVEVKFTINERQILISARDLTRETDLEIQRVSAKA